MIALVIILWCVQAKLVHPCISILCVHMQVLDEDRLRGESTFSGGLVGLSDMTLPQFLCRYVYKEVSPEDTVALFREIGINE